MKRSVKIVLIASLIINVCFISLQIIGSRKRSETIERNIKNNYKQFTKFVNIADTKRSFLDSLHKKYPETINKKYLFINIWSTGDGWSIKQLPILDTLILPLKSDMSYILVNDEKPDYSVRVLKQDTATTINFLFMHQCEDFMYAMSQELRLKRSYYNYPRTPLLLILDPSGKIIVSDTMQAIAGKRWWPKEKVDDEKHITFIKKILSELK
jgi:hypothetical protein